MAVKWVVEEAGTSQALSLRGKSAFVAPELIIAECANILWKKVQRGQLARMEGLLAARLLERSDIEFLSTRSLLEASTGLAIELGHPAYDCLYLALAEALDCPFVTADEGLVRKLRQQKPVDIWKRAITLREAAGAD